MSIRIRPLPTSLSLALACLVTAIPAARAQDYPSPQASPQSLATVPCVCPFPTGYCAFPTGYCPFPTGYCGLPQGPCATPLSSPQGVIPSPQGFVRATSTPAPTRLAGAQRRPR